MALLAPRAGGESTLLVPDLGCDRVMQYRLDAATGALRVNPAGAARGVDHPGAGPRHAAFHPSLPVVFVVHELHSTLSLHPFDSAAGTLGAALQTCSTLPAGSGQDGRGCTSDSVSTCAAVRVHPNGNFVYVRCARARSPSVRPFAAGGTVPSLFF